MTSHPSPERWRRIQSVLERALQLRADAREAWLDRACSDDPVLRADVARILAADAEAGGVLETISGAVLEQFIEEARQQTTLTQQRQPERPVDLERIVRDLLGQRKRDGIADRAPGGVAASWDAAGRLLPGAMIGGRYRLTGMLGRGGMGEVYRSDDLKLGQCVALKFLPTTSEKEAAHLDRLLNEVKLARQVTHPNVCRVYDVGEAEGRHFISMEYVDGENLASLLTRIRRLPREKALEISRQLCAGLAAAHAQGILHRDLKPANVMLDGRGRVRITDFGLASAGAVEQGRQAREGTPAYQAPEQLEGREATARSDLYALGLLLYEVFTGRRPFPADSRQGLRRQQQESTPASLSSLVEGIDPSVDRAILKCLEYDPAMRPSSVLAVAAALPGGDPIAAALAAGETPSPELVAASGPQGALMPRTAWSLLAGVLVLLTAVVALSDGASVLGWIPAPKSADALEENARDILKRLGHDTARADSSRRIGSTTFLWGFVNAGDRGTAPDRWKAFRQTGELTMAFEYREATRLLVPMGSRGTVAGSDDPPMEPGDALVVTDLRGRLMQLWVEPPGTDQPAGDGAPPDWPALLALAGLDVASYAPVEPTRNTPVFADSRAAFRGTLAKFGDVPVRIDAAAYRGKPIWFELVTPWDPFWEVPVRGSTPSAGLPPVMLLILSTIVAVAVTAFALALHNWRRGRADRRGAIRVAGVIFCMRLAWWILGGHHVPDVLHECWLFLTAASGALWAGAVIWCLYIALEPYARRLYPRFMVAWARLVDGRLRDPLVGRALLIGLAVGTFNLIVRLQLNVVVPHWLGLNAPPPPQPGWIWFAEPRPQAILGGRQTLAALVGVFPASFSIAFFFLLLLIGLRLALRKDWIAFVLFGVFLVVTSPPQHLGGVTATSIVCATVPTVTLLWLLSRHGIVATVCAAIPWNVYAGFPITGSVDSPYFGTGLVGVLLVGGLAAYGAATAMSRRSLSEA
jgi:serine/threonine-protein kinase